ncbi:MAG TPA: hypothetical protein VFY16_04325 [Gemmatimonadaceae bacterium]|nr:hypothetical protein [Gemmatimonadaceae bacterium]
MPSASRPPEPSSPVAVSGTATKPAYSAVTKQVGVSPVPLLAPTHTTQSLTRMVTSSSTRWRRLNGSSSWIPVVNPSTYQPSSPSSRQVRAT